jgi:hypothetical protein
MDIRDTEALAEEILHIVKDWNGLKLSLMIKELNTTIGTKVVPFEIVNLVNELVQQKKLMEIEFTCDMMKVDSFLVPAKTKLNIRGEVPEPPRRI